MRTLYIIRHAKSSWKDLSLSDWERPLNKRGKRDIPTMAKFLQKRKVVFDLLISSTALRAKKTAKGIGEGVGYDKHEIKLEHKLYHANAHEILKIVRAIPSQNKAVAIFGHNPGFTDFVNELCGTDLVNIPTCGICQVDLAIDDWSNALKGNGSLKFFKSPKTI